MTFCCSRANRLISPGNTWSPFLDFRKTSFRSVWQEFVFLFSNFLSTDPPPPPALLLNSKSPHFPGDLKHFLVTFWDLFFFFLHCNRAQIRSVFTTFTIVQLWCPLKVGSDMWLFPHTCLGSQLVTQPCLFKEACGSKMRSTGNPRENWLCLLYFFVL